MQNIIYKALTGQIYFITVIYGGARVGMCLETRLIAGQVFNAKVHSNKRLEYIAETISTEGTGIYDAIETSEFSHYRFSYKNEVKLCKVI